MSNTGNTSRARRHLKLARRTLRRQERGELTGARLEQSRLSFGRHLRIANDNILRREEKGWDVWDDSELYWRTFDEGLRAGLVHGHLGSVGRSYVSAGRFAA